MGKLKLLAYIVVVELIAFGVFFAFLLGKVVAQGGAVTLDMTYFHEMWLEYIVMVVLTALAPWALWYITEKTE
jgi:membrane protein implicated in regulation of membrane protease activity